MNTAPTTPITVRIPSHLHRRCKVIGKRNGLSMTDLIRDGLADRVDALELKERAIAEREQVIKEQKRRKPRLGQGPVSIEEAETVERVALERVPDLLDPVYDEHARRIVAVLANPLEVSIRKREAVAALRRYAPLTYPPEGEMLQRLEERVRALAPPAADAPEAAPSVPQRATPAQDALLLFVDRLARHLQAPPPPPADPFVGRTLPSSTKTRGVIEE